MICGKSQMYAKKAAIPKTPIILMLLKYKLLISSILLCRLAKTGNKAEDTADGIKTIASKNLYPAPYNPVSKLPLK